LNCRPVPNSCPRITCPRIPGQAGEKDKGRGKRGQYHDYYPKQVMLQVDIQNPHCVRICKFEKLCQREFEEIER
jgi:hypothetical protein